MSSSFNDRFIQSTNHKHDRSTLLPDIESIFARILRGLFPKLKETNAFILPLEGVAREKHGDYACFNVMELCQEKRKQNPNLFDRTKPKHIARAIINALQIEKPNMISKRSLRLHDVGVITFKLDGTWMAQRLETMLHDGIDTLAPRIYKRKARAVFISRLEEVRSICIIEALARMYLYSGLDVLVEAILAADADPEIIRFMVHMHEADILVYMVPHFQREFIQGCFTAARREGCLQEATLSSCGIRNLSDYQEEKMFSLYRDFKSKFASLFELAEAAGYTMEEFFACLIIYTCLKSHRRAECSFNMEDMLDEKGNTFVYVLKTRALISSVIKNSRGACLFKSKEALAGKEERELGLHLMEFSGVIETAYSALVPNVVCEYLCDLSKLFTSYYRKVRPGKAAILGLCKATEVIMDKCFDLLGIAPGISSVFGFASSKHAILSHARHVLCREISEARIRNDEYPNSRLEMFSMTVSVAHSTVDEGYIFGTISVIDAFGARADGWTMSDEKDYCYVSYFNSEWYEPLGMFNGSCIPIGDPSCRRSVPVSSFIKVHVLLHATSKEKDEYYKICCCDHDDLELSKFWDGVPKAMCGTLKYESDDGQVLVNYVLLKEAVDATMELKFRSNSDVPLQVSGSIMAYYGDGVVADDGGILGQFKAVIFETKNSRLVGKEVSLKLHKSGLAVPANGCLKIVASLTDLQTKKAIVDGMEEYRARPGSTDNWKMECGRYSFNLKVAWS